MQEHEERLADLQAELADTQAELANMHATLAAKEEIEAQLRAEIQRLDGIVRYVQKIKEE